MRTERQDQIIEGLIIRSPVKMYISEVLELTPEYPDARIYTLTCSCSDQYRVAFDHGKEGQWVMVALNAVRSHIKSSIRKSLNQSPKRLSLKYSTD